MSDPIRGQKLVETTKHYAQWKLVDNLDVVAWLIVNREHVQRHGCCPGGCDKTLVKHEAHGYLVCPLTYEPCVKDDEEQNAKT